MAVALAGAMLVTLGLVDLPPARALFRFAPLAWQWQLGIIGYAVAYTAAADALKRAFARVEHAVARANGGARLGRRGKGAR